MGEEEDDGGAQAFALELEVVRGYPGEEGVSGYYLPREQVHDPFRHLFQIRFYNLESLSPCYSSYLWNL